MSKHDVLKKLVKICHNRIWNDEEAITYLRESRKLTDATIKKFKIGLFPKDLRELFNEIDAKILREEGLIKHASKSPFQTRDLVLPVKDVYGNYIALAGRTRLTEEQREKYNISKYYNSIYSKGQHLFGLNFAKRSIIKNNKAYVVEGHYDVIMPHQEGLENVVGVCGANLTTRQMALLSRYTNNIVLLFDNEPKAINITKKIIEKKQQKGINLIAINPFPKDIKDLDEFLKKYSVQQLESKLNYDGYENIYPRW